MIRRQSAEHIRPAIAAAKHGAQAALAIGDAIDGTNDKTCVFRCRADSLGKTRARPRLDIRIRLIATASANEDDHGGYRFVLRVLVFT